jgi:hypothetical protein
LTKNIHHFLFFSQPSKQHHLKYFPANLIFINFLQIFLLLKNLFLKYYFLLPPKLIHLPLIFFFSPLLNLLHTKNYYYFFIFILHLNQKNKNPFLHPYLSIFFIKFIHFFCLPSYSKLTTFFYSPNHLLFQLQNLHLTVNFFSYFFLHLPSSQISLAPFNFILPLFAPYLFFHSVLDLITILLYSSYYPHSPNPLYHLFLFIRLYFPKIIHFSL